jgi:hypothetical protein
LPIGDSFEIKELPEPFSFETDFPRSTTDGLFVSISQRDIDIEHTLGSEPIMYTLGDTRSEIKFRGINPVIMTDTRIQTTGRTVTILVSPRLGVPHNLELFLRRDPKLVARVIQKIEKEYIIYTSPEKFVFSDHPNWSSNFHGLAERLGAFGVVDRP